MARYSTIIQAFIDRIEGHMAPGGILADWTKFVTIPTEEAEGKKDFPNARLWMPQIAEKAHSQLTIVTNGSLKVHFEVATDKDFGIPAHILAVETFADALELDPTGPVIDLLLGDRLAKPFELSFQSSIEKGALSMRTAITATVVPTARKSGGRRS